MGKKLTTSQVQRAFNAAVLRRDKICRVRDDTPCGGGLQCSHFYPVGGNGGLRFYPENAYAQCAGHHFAHHNRNPAFYHEFMELRPDELEWMQSVRGRPVRWTQETLRAIYDACRKDNLREVRRIVRKLLEGIKAGEDL